MCKLQAIWLAALTLGTAAAQTTLTAFGDSITEGNAASDSTNRFVNIITAVKRWSLVNHGVSWSGVADAADNIYGTSISASNPYLYMIGTNDVRIYAEDQTLRTVFQEAHLAELAWLGLPADVKITGRSPRVSYAGSWGDSPGLGPVGYGIGKSSFTQGDSATFTVAGRILLIGTIVADGNGGEFSLTVDGASQGRFRCYAATSVLTHRGRTYAPKGIRLSGLSDGNHLVVVTVTSPTHPQNRVYFDWAAGIQAQTAFSTVYAGSVPRFGSDSIYGWTGWKYSTMIAANARTLRGDGLDIQYVDVAGYMDQHADLEPDSVHPNDAGHRHIAQAYLDAIDRPAEGAAVPRIQWGGIVNGFTGQYTPVAPGEIVTIYGASLGPGTGLAAIFDPVTGLLPQTLGGTTVTIGGALAVFYYSSESQINIQIPYELSGRTMADLTITYNGNSATSKVAMSPIAPGLVNVVFNEDGTVNSPDNPAAPGSLLELFGTGQGVTVPATKTGAYPRAQIYPIPAAPFEVRIGGVSADFYFYGQAPLTAGVIQLTVRVPDSVTGAVPFYWDLNAIPAPSNVTIYVAQP